MLELKLLGSPHILLDGRPVSGLSAAKSQALLFYLAVNGRPQTRQALAGLLWPDKREADALANLRQALYHLRNALPDYLEINRLTVALNPALPCQVDAVLFENQLAERNPQAVDRYTGEFLAGFYVDEADPFEAWAVVIRERLHHLATEALHHLVADLGEQQDSVLGLRYVNQWLALEPWREEAHRHKLQFLAWDGQQQAALSHYERCRQLLAEELGVEPSAETLALVEQIQQDNLRITRPKGDRKLRNNVNPFRSSLAEAARAEKSLDHAQALENRKSEIVNQHDWGEIPTVRTLWGREAEAQQIEQWLVTEQQRIVTILGMGGMGKTTLAAALAPRLAPHFTWVFWRSLLNAPPLSDILRDWVQTLSSYTLTTWPTLLDAQLTLLFEQLRRQRCLLILDNVESILNPANEQQGGAYPPEYADYGQFFARLGDSVHQSALLLTSRELPPELARLERRGAPVRRLPLSGLPLAAGQRLLADDGLVGAVEQQQELLRRYSGNPLALQLVSKTIQDFFAGEIAAFLSDETLFFDDVREVLDQQFARLTTLERELLLWLAIEREPVPLPLLQGELLYAGPKSAILDALLDLQQRTLLEKTPTGFTLQNVIMEYATAYLVDAICQEIEAATPDLLHSHALLKAQAKEYIRQSQTRLLLQPIGERLQKKLGMAGIETKFKALLAQVQQSGAARATYTGGNILNLLLYLGMTPSPYDFSQIAVWQADLRKADLQMLNLAQADLHNTLFAQNFIGCHTLAFSPDGKLLAGGMANGEIHLWRTANHQLDTIIKAHETIIWDLVFSPDGQWLASGSKDGSIRLWDVQTRQCQRTFTGHTDWVRAVAFHPTGRILASGGHDQTVRLWDVRSGRILHVLDNHAGWVMGLAFSPDGERLVSASTDQTVRLWDLHTGQETLVLRGHSACTESLCFSPDGSILASASYDQTICLWDLSTPVEPDRHPLLRVLQGHKGAIYGAAFSADGRRIFSAGHEEMIYVWDVETGQRLSVVPAPGREVNALAVHPAGAVLATSETGASAIYLWEIEAKPTLSHIFYGYRNWANDVAFHPHLPLVASASPADKVHLWDALTGQHLQVFRCENGIGTSVAIGSQPNGEGAQLVFGSMDHSAWLWPLQQPSSTSPSQRAAPLVLPAPGEVHSVAFSPDGRQVLTSGYDGAVHLWDAQTGQPLRKFLIDGDRRLKAVSMSADGCFIAAGSHNVTVALWHVATGEYQPLHGHTEWVWAVAFHPSGILASGSFDRTVRLWNVHNGEVQQVLPHEARIVQVLAFNHDGSRLAVGTGDAMIYLWDARALTSTPTQPLPLVHKWKAHFEVIQGLAFSSDGRWLASASLDGTIKVWDVFTHECHHTLQAPGPYAGMNITGATGLTEAQKGALKTLGALEAAPVATLAASHPRSLAEPKAQETTTRQEAPPASDALPTPVLHNLPQPATPFVGRADDLVELAAKLANPACRLLTLFGAGGMGKTRLAIAAAGAHLERFAGEVFFVPLAAITQPTALAFAIASALGLTLRGHDPQALLVQALRPRRLLLILDNFEQLLPDAVAAAYELPPDAADARVAISLLVELLQSAPQVHFLVTSRERLNMRGEQLHWVKGMPCPQQVTLTEATASSAVQLFVQSAQRIQPDFALTTANLPAVLRICQLVQGMPLALELATAWLDHLSLTEIAQAIVRSADFLAADWHDLPVRQRSMRAVFGWSWRLLPESEQRVLRQLAIFQGGFTRQAAGDVVSATLRDLSSLGHKSLLRYSPTPLADHQDDASGQARYAMHELLRQFAAEALPAAERTVVAAQHGRFYLTLLAEQAQPLARHAPHQARQMIQQDLDNVRQAWRWAIDHAQSDLLERAAYPWWQFTQLSGLEAEGEQSFRLAIAGLRTQLAQMGAPNPQWQRTLSLLLALHADYLFWHGDYAQMAAEAREAIVLGAASGGVEGETMGYFSLGWAMQELGPQAEARAAWEQSIQLARRYQTHHPNSELLYEVEWMAHDWLRGVLFHFEEFALGHAAAVAAVRICQTLGKVRGEMFALASLAGCDYYLGNYVTARQEYQEALTLIRQLDYPLGEASGQRGLGLVLRLQNEYTLAHAAFVQALTIARRIGVTYYEAFSLIYLVRLHCQLGDWAGARRWLDELEALLVRVPLTPTLQAHYQMANAVYHYFTGDKQAALNLAEAANPVFDQFDIPTHRADAAVIIGYLRASLQQTTAAAAYTQAVALYEKLGNRALATEAQAGLAQLALQQGDAQQAHQLVDSILPVLTTQPCATVHTPLYTYLVCYQVLATTDPARAAGVLQQAQALLANYAGRIPDAELRRAFLADVPVHRQLAAVALPTPETLATADDSTGTLAPRSPAPPRAPVVLPAEVTGFVGRETEIVLVQQRLADPACRLLTITGMGGVGKSRLALRTAHLLAARLTNAQTPQFWDGIYYVPLAALEPHPQLEHLLATTVAAVLGIPLTGAAPTSQLLQALAEKDLLLILDNCEHLPVAAFIHQLLQQSRAVKLLVTSRARINLRGEQLIRLTGLTIPTVTLPAQVTDEAIWQINDHSAIRFFVQSVQAIRPDFTLDPTTAAPVTQICQLLHGLPLGIELAATWAHLLPLPEIVQEIRQNLDFLENAQLETPLQQRSLRAVFNHSWQLLTAAEQQVLRRLAVFRGGFTREAAAQVAGATLPLLAQLTDKSLVQRIDPASETATSAKARYELQPVVQQYAAEQLAQAGETAAYQERHALYMAQFLAAQRAALQSAQQQEALRTLHAEIENVRAAWQWLLAHLQTNQTGLAQLAELVSQGFDSLFHFYDMRSWFQEGETVFGQLAQRLPAFTPPLPSPPANHIERALWRLQANAQARQGWFAFHLGRYAESRHLLTESLQRLQQLQAEADTIFNLNYLGALLRHLGEFDQAITYLQAAQRLAQQHNDPMGTSIALNILGQIALLRGALAEAQQFCQQALQLKRAIGDQWGMTFSLGYLGRVAQMSGDYGAAQKLLAESLAICQAIGDQRGAAFTLQSLGDTAYATGELAEAQARYQESLSIYRAISNRAESSLTLARLGETWRATGDPDQARQFLREALALAWPLRSTPGLLAALLGLAALALADGQRAQALPLLRFVAQHPSNSQQQRAQAVALLTAAGATDTEDSAWDLTTYVETILGERL
ncbi:MAG: tetratricopeptide repeat protein [Caldilineaceae bacterium]